MVNPLQPDFLFDYKNKIFFGKEGKIVNIIRSMRSTFSII